MKKLLSLFVLVCLLSPAAMAEEEKHEEHQADDQVSFTSIDKDEPSPIDGFVLDAPTMIDIYLKNKYDKKECETKVEFLKKEHDILIELERKNNKVQVDYLQSKISSEAKPITLVATGFFVGTALSVGIFYIATQIVR
jgi:hypothetical protein